MIYRDKDDDDAVLQEDAVHELLDADEDDDEKIDLPDPEEEEKWE